MFKANLEIIQKRLPFIIIALIIILGFVFYFSWPREEVQEPEVQPEVISPQDYGAGEIGEVMVKDEKTGQEGPLVSSDIPAVIVNTSGTIIEVREDRIIVRGEGTNFADGLSRTLSVFFTDETITFSSRDPAFHWLGAVGLKKLKSGMEILIGSSQNIRGKTEFSAKTIKVL